MKRIAIVVAVAGVCLVACAPMPTGGGGGITASPCNNGVCKVDVDVTSCVITPTPDPLYVHGENNIFWELNLSSRFYRFTEDGVKLKKPDPTFDQPEKLNDWKFKLHDKGTPGTYLYAIKVQHLVMFQWVDCPPLDPTIVNG
jgi:hypothetical protein